MKPRVLTGAAVAVAAALLLVGCHPGSSSTADPSVSAARSSAAAVAEADARAYFGKCVPASATGQVQLVTSLGTASGRQSLMDCAGVPQADRSAAAACAVGNIEHNGPAPKGTSAKLGWLLAQAYPCAARYHGATPAVSAT